MKVDLEAHRCPDATILMRRVIENFLSSEHSTLEITSIEPSLKRNLIGYIESMSLNLNLDSENAEDITEGNRVDWEPKFDEEDYEDVTQRVTLTLTKAD